MGTATDTLIAVEVRTWTQLMVILLFLMLWKMFLAAQRSSAVSVQSGHGLGACCCEVTPVSPCHIYYPPENVSSNQLDTSQGKDEQDQLSKPIPVRHFNRPDIHSTLFSVCSLLFCCVSIKILSLLRKGTHMSVCFYNTHPKPFSELKSFQPQVSASMSGED